MTRKIPFLISNSPIIFPDAFSSNFHDFMLLFKKSCTLFAIPNISKYSLIQLWDTVFLLSIHGIARLVCLLLQSLSTVLSTSSCLFHDSLYGIFFVQMVVHSLFLSDSISFQLTFQSQVSTSRSGIILVYIYHLHCLMLGLRSSNLVRVFLHQGYDLAVLP